MYTCIALNMHGHYTCLLSSEVLCSAFLAASSEIDVLPLVAEVVKVPQMAESISEGTLKQWLKKKGDYVELDEEVATIETDKVWQIKQNKPVNSISRKKLD